MSPQTIIVTEPSGHGAAAMAGLAYLQRLEESRRSPDDVDLGRVDVKARGQFV